MLRRIIGVVLFVAATASVSKADGWFWVCQYYDQINPLNDCGLVPDCPGACGKYGGPVPPASDCGDCVETWNPLSYCKNASSPTYVSFYKLYWPLPGFVGDFSLAGIEVEAAEVEEDVGFEAFPVAITEGLLHQAGDAVVETL